MLRFLPRPGPAVTSLILALYIGGVLNLSVFGQRLSKGGNGLSTALEALAMVLLCYALLALLALGGRWVYRPLASALLLFSAAASYYMTFFKVVVGYGVVISVLTLDVDLSKESLGFKFFIWLSITALPALWLIWRCPFTSEPGRRFSWRWRLLAGALLAGLLCALSLQAITQIKKRQALAGNEYTASVGGIVAHSYLPTNWLSGLGLHLYQLQSDARAKRQDLFSPAKAFHYQAAAPMEDTYVVFVIGETTRSDHMSLLGYERDTNPLLAQEANLVAFNGHACDTATKLSLRCMFVREGGAENNTQRTVKENNVFAVLKDLGFSSELYSMQSEVWFYNSLHANRYEIREVLASAYADSGKPIDDMLLVEEMDKSLQRHPKGKHLIVLHTKGSHYLYSQRYPQGFAHFFPECLGIDAACSEAQLFNSFDNSVRYVDYVLKQAIDRLRDKQAILFYTSDHGESIGENAHFHATPREVAPPEQFRVPMLVWASDRFLAAPARRAGFEKLKLLANKGKVGRHEELFDSVLGCLGYSSPNGGIAARNNWCDYTAAAQP